MESEERRDGELYPKQCGLSEDQQQGPEQQALWVQPQVRCLSFCPVPHLAWRSHEVTVSTEAGQGHSSTVSELTLNRGSWTPGALRTGLQHLLVHSGYLPMGFARRGSADGSPAKDILCLSVSVKPKSTVLPSRSSCACFRPDLPCQALLS